MRECSNQFLAGAGLLIPVPSAEVLKQFSAQNNASPIGTGLPAKSIFPFIFFKDGITPDIVVVFSDVKDRRSISQSPSPHVHPLR